MIATIRYQEVVMWKKPGGHHHVKILHKGDKVDVLQGWSFNERTWKDKRYVKVERGGRIGYILAEALTDGEVKTTPYNYEEVLDDGLEDTT
jgi:hypothetical protein